MYCKLLFCICSIVRGFNRVGRGMTSQRGEGRRVRTEHTYRSRGVRGLGPRSYGPQMGFLRRTPSSSTVFPSSYVASRHYTHSFQQATTTPERVNRVETLAPNWRRLNRRALAMWL